MQATLDASLLDYLDEALAEPDEIVWALPGQEDQQTSKRPNRAMWGRTADALVSQQRAEQVRQP
jgi:hypothetical protein